MHKVSRSIFTGLLLVAGLTACGDKISLVGTGSGGSTGAGVVHSVTITPPSVSLGAGQTVVLVASVDADAGLARTVTWLSTNTAIATVSATGTVTASSTNSGTVAITATSTADPTVSAAASIIVTPVTNATISISTINQGGLPANLASVAGQVDVTLNVDQGTQTITKLDLIAHNVGTNTDTTVATYNFTTPDKAPVSATSAPITMSFNTAAYNPTTGQVAFVNGPYTMRARATVAGTSGQAPVSSSINYTLNNVDFIAMTAKGDTVANDATGLQWTAGKINIGVVPVLYNNIALSSIIVTPDAAATHTSPITLTTYPSTAAFLVGKDTITKSPFQATVTAVYANGTPFNGGVAFNAPTVREDNQAPAQPTVNQLKGGLSHWLGAAYAFGGSSDYKAANGDVGFPTTPGVGNGATQFWVFPSASFPTALSATGAVAPNTNVGSAAKCVTTGGTMVTTASQLANSAPNDSTTYMLRTLQYDKLGNVVCADLPAFGGAAAFGVDLGAPVSAKYANAGAGTNAGGVNPLLTGSNGGYNVGDFTGFQPTAVDSISGFSLTNDVTQTVSVNDATTPATKCSVFTAPANATTPPCTVKSGAGVLFPVTGTGGINDEGYYTIGASIADRAGNSVALPGTVIAIDRTAPAGSGGVAIPASLVGGSAISLTGTVTDNMTLMSGGGSVQYTTLGAINYDASSSFASAGTFGTLNKTGTASLNVPIFLSALQNGNGGLDPIVQFNIRGTDEVGLSGSLVVPFGSIPAGNITTGAGNGSGGNGIWTGADFNTWTVTNAAILISTGAGTNARSVALTATINVPPAVGLPFNNVCFYYFNTQAVTTSAAPAFAGEWKPTGLCVATAATSDNVNWVYTSGAWTPPATLPLGAVQIMALGFGVNGHASYTPTVSTITITN